MESLKLKTTISRSVVVMEEEVDTLSIEKCACICEICQFSVPTSKLHWRGDDGSDGGGGGGCGGSGDGDVVVTEVEVVVVIVMVVVTVVVVVVVVVVVIARWW